MVSRSQTVVLRPAASETWVLVRTLILRSHLGPIKFEPLVPEPRNFFCFTLFLQALQVILM